MQGACLFEQSKKFQLSLGRGEVQCRIWYIFGHFRLIFLIAREVGPCWDARAGKSNWLPAQRTYNLY